MSAFAWRMMRLGPGDWLQCSDDQQRLYRMHTYEDGAAHGLCDTSGMPVAYESRRFWRVVVMPMPLHRGEPMIVPMHLPDAWESAWSEVDWYMPTRAAALAGVERAEAELVLT